MADIVESTGLSWAYIAGFFDGGGHASVCCSKGGTQFFVGLVQSGDEGAKVLLATQNYLSCHGINSNLHVDVHKGKLSKQQIYRLVITNRKSVVAFLVRVLPFLWVKKVAAQDIIRYDKIIPRRTGKERGLLLNQGREHGNPGGITE